MPNIGRPEFDELREQPGFRCLRARLGRQAGCERLGLSLFEVPPGEAAYPYHYHLAEEELLLVLAGWPSLRTSEGWRELEEGELVAFPRGERGAHQIINRTEEAVRLLALVRAVSPTSLSSPTPESSGPTSVDRKEEAYACGFGPRTPLTTTMVRSRRSDGPAHLSSRRFAALRIARHTSRCVHRRFEREARFAQRFAQASTGPRTRRRLRPSDVSL